MSLQKVSEVNCCVLLRRGQRTLTVTDTVRQHAWSTVQRISVESADLFEVKAWKSSVQNLQTKINASESRSLWS